MAQSSLLSLRQDARRSLLPPTAASAMSNSPRTLFGLSTIGRAMEFLAVPGMHMQEAAAGIAQAVAAKAMLASAADQSWKLVSSRKALNHAEQLLSEVVASWNCRYLRHFTLLLSLSSTAVAFP